MQAAATVDLRNPRGKGRIALSLSLPAKMVDALTRLAREQHRPRSHQVEMILAEHPDVRAYLPPSDD